MTNYLSPGCCCEEGCLFFYMQHFFTSPTRLDGNSLNATPTDRWEDDDEGRRILTKRIPAGGNWTIELFHYPSSDSDHRIECYLLRDDDSVFCRWEMDFRDFTIDGKFFADEEGGFATEWSDCVEGSTELPFSGDSIEDDVRITFRPSGVIFDHPHDFNGTNDGAPDSKNQAIYQTLGFPVPDGALDDAGPLRFAAKITRPASEHFGDLAFRIHRIEVEPDPNDPEQADAESERPECPLPTACPLNYPSYTTPRFDLFSIDGPAAPPFGDRELLYTDCRGEIHDHGTPYVRTDESNAERAFKYDGNGKDEDDWYHYDYVGGSEPVVKPTRHVTVRYWIYDGENPGQRIVQLHCRWLGYSWRSSPCGDDFSYHGGAAYLEDGVYKLGNPTFASPPPYGLHAGFSGHSFHAIYRKTVPAWEGTPPTITFTGDDLQSADGWDASPSQVDADDVIYAINSVSYDHAKHRRAFLYRTWRIFYTASCTPMPIGDYQITIGPEDAGHLPQL